MQHQSIIGNTQPATALRRNDRSTVRASSLRVFYLFLLGLGLVLPEPWESAAGPGYYTVADKGLYTASSLPPVDRCEHDPEYAAVSSTFTLLEPESLADTVQRDPQYAHSLLHHRGNGIRAPPTFSS